MNVLSKQHKNEFFNGCTTFVNVGRACSIKQFCVWGHVSSGRRGPSVSHPLVLSDVASPLRGSVHPRHRSPRHARRRTWITLTCIAWRPNPRPSDPTLMVTHAIAFRIQTRYSACSGFGLPADRKTRRRRPAAKLSTRRVQKMNHVCACACLHGVLTPLRTAPAQVNRA